MSFTSDTGHIAFRFTRRLAHGLATQSECIGQVGRFVSENSEPIAEMNEKAEYSKGFFWILRISDGVQEGKTRRRFSSWLCLLFQE